MRQLIAALVLFPAAVAAQTQSGSDAQTTALAYGHRIPVLSAQAARRTGPIVLEAGGPSRFGHLEGLHIPAATSRLELLRYAVSKSQSLAATKGDPFATRGRPGFRAGLDIKARGLPVSVLVGTVPHCLRQNPTTSSSSRRVGGYHGSKQAFFELNFPGRRRTYSM